MKINIANIGPKEWVDFKSDISFGLYYALKSLGHDVSIGFNEVNTMALNLIIGSDILVNHNDFLTSITRNKIDYMIYEVESFDGKTVNDRAQFMLGNYQALLANAKAVITPYHANLKSLGEICDSGKLHYAKWGYHPNLINERIIRTSNFNFDALFFGMLKGLHKEKSDQLMRADRFKIKFMGAQDPLTLKDYFVSVSKWGLSLSYGASEKFVNPFQLYYMAANGMPVLADNVIDDDGYLAICEHSNFEDMAQKIAQDTPPASVILERCRAQNLAENLRGIL